MTDCLPECDGYTTPGGPRGPPESVAICVEGCPCDGCEAIRARPVVDAKGPE
jgi:hypothetical protein